MLAWLLWLYQKINIIIIIRAIDLQVMCTGIFFTTGLIATINPYTNWLIMYCYFSLPPPSFLLILSSSDYITLHNQFLRMTVV